MAYNLNLPTVALLQDQDQDQDQEILFQLGKTFNPKTMFQGTQNKNMIHTQMGMSSQVIDTKAE